MNWLESKPSKLKTCFSLTLNELVQEKTYKNSKLALNELAREHTLKNSKLTLVGAVACLDR